ncbi:MAG: N-acetyl-gamma-glutamyl-phosphate reductase [Burkholderiaceae bacterium]
MSARIFIDGDQGTTGLQIQSRLSARDDIKLITLPASRRKDIKARSEALNECDVAVLCLPDDAARQAVSLIRNSKVRVIDASSAHRTDSEWTYGFPEVATVRAVQIAEARRVSNPGCYPTGAVALLRPLIEGNILRPDAPLTIHAVSGYSGRGRAGVEAHEGPRRSRQAPFQTYGLDLRHKHVPEIQVHAGLTHPPIFVPSYGNFRQGISLTVPLHLSMLKGNATGAVIREVLRNHYGAFQAVRVLDEVQSGDMPSLNPQAMNDTDDLQLAVFENQGRGQVLLTAVFDNLGKGAAGAAIQNLNLMIGHRKAGLRFGRQEA